MNELIKSNLISFLLEDPLYSELNLEEFEMNDILNLIYHVKDHLIYGKLKVLDSFCPICNLNTTYISSETIDENLDFLARVNNTRDPWATKNKDFIKRLENIGSFQKIFNCPRAPHNTTHDLVFSFKAYNNKLIKTGQFPSIADLNKNEIEKYRKLNKNIYQELNRAIGLMSHGIGVGSFVYLRRIIEMHILLPVLKSMIVDGKLTESDLKESDFKKKISIAKDQLPDFLVKNKKVYSILSKGIHQLSEDECRTVFPVLRKSIEIILDHQIELLEKSKKVKIIERELDNIN